jgi:glucose/arabinose dehydrogenase
MKTRSGLVALAFLLSVGSITLHRWVSHPVRAQSSLTLALDSIVTGLSLPVFVTHAGDGSNRLFILEQAGRIRIFQNGSLISTPFLDIQNRVTSGGERGLLGIAFHPDYRNNRRFFLNYTHNRPTLKTIIAEYQTSPSNPNAAQTAERVLLEINQPFDNHNGGQLLFGPDGFFYVGMGDGGSGGDPQNHAQNLDSLLGKMLRIDVDGAQPYAVPPTNPFLNRNGADEIWAFGLRNPWRFSFDRLTGRLFAADVGQSAREEVDVIERAGNYGWRRYEGSLCFNPSSGCENPAPEFPFRLPIAEYGRSEGVSVTGGYVYRGRLFPELIGTYLFSDYGSGRIWGLTETSRGAWTRTELLRSGLSVSSFGEDEAGEVYVVHHSGSIHRIRVVNPQPASSRSILIPSSVRSDRFTSSLILINGGSAPEQVTLTQRAVDGAVRASTNLNLSAGGVFQTDDVLGFLGLPLGAFGPITLEPASGLPLTVVSEVRSTNGTAGFYGGRSRTEASVDRVIPEAIDSGVRGESGTFRTNLGVNNLSAGVANVRVTLIDGAGSIRGSHDLTVSPFGMTQVDGIARRILGASSQTAGYLKLTSDQLIHAWASKIHNGTDDPSFETAIGQSAIESGPRLLIPSVVRSSRFTSSLVVINRDSTQTVNYTITARSTDGAQLATLAGQLAPGAAYRTADVMTDLGIAGEPFGPLSIETAQPVALAAASEVRSASGTAGFFPAVSFSSAAVQKLVPEIVDTGDRGSAGTFRTNLGLNNLGPEEARVRLELVGSGGSVLGAATVQVPSRGLRQIDSVARVILAQAGPTGVRGYVRVFSSQPMHVWASKIDNGTDDPSIVMGTP